MFLGGDTRPLRELERFKTTEAAAHLPSPSASSSTPQFHLFIHSRQKNFTLPTPQIRVNTNHLYRTLRPTTMGLKDWCRRFMYKVREILRIHNDFDDFMCEAYFDYGDSLTFTGRPWGPVFQEFNRVVNEEAIWVEMNMTGSFWKFSWGLEVPVFRVRSFLSERDVLFWSNWQREGQFRFWLWRWKINDPFGFGDHFLGWINHRADEFMSKPDWSTFSLSI